jgi:response regulator NasT
MLVMIERLVLDPSVDPAKLAAILDIKMPGMDGIAAASHITATSETAVLLLTAFSQRNLIQEARDAGVAAYLVKPFRRAELIPAIEGVLERAREERAIAAEVAGEHPERVAEDKLETRRLVDEAKAVLIASSSMSEDEAFQFIQRTAMQTRTRMRDVAASVVQGTLAPD